MSKPRASRQLADLRQQVFRVLEHGPFGDRLNRHINGALVGLIVVNLVSVALESVPSLAADYALLFRTVEWVSLLAFTVEYLLRIWVAVESETDRGATPTTLRLRYVLSPTGIVDLLAVAPFWISLITGADLRVLLVFRMVRFLKLARYSPGMRSLLEAVNSERRALFGTLVIITGATLVAASVMQLIEGDVQPDKFGTIPDGMWWAIVTLATVGYGDVTPVTALGKLFTSIYILVGIILIALPIGIVATAFANEIHRRDFVVTWGMVARVPLFQGLGAAEIADISRLLRAQTVEPGGVIVRRGELGHSMYFIASGEVEVDLGHRRVRLGVGDFFGEVAVLKQTRRSATVTAATRVRLLALDAHDLEALMEREPQIGARIHQVIHERNRVHEVTPSGDVTTTELAQGVVEKKPVRTNRRRKASR